MVVGRQKMGGKGRAMKKKKKNAKPLADNFDNQILLIFFLISLYKKRKECSHGKISLRRLLLIFMLDDDGNVRIMVLDLVPHRLE